MERIRSGEMNGLINLLKPPGMTSHQAVNKIRRILGMKRIGHLGTLDPAAAGVLPICVGTTTRLAEYMMNWDKEYRVESLLGATSDTGDTSGQLEVRKQPVLVSDEQINQALTAMIGRQWQIPPMTSAVRYQGKRLYEWDRQGKQIVREPRPIEIKNVQLCHIFRTDGWTRVLFDTVVSKGTYIRVLCGSLGSELGCGAVMSFLVRSRAGPFELSHAWSLEEIMQAVQEADWSFLLPADYGLHHWPSVTMDDERLSRIRHGAEVRLGEGGEKIDRLACDSYLRILDQEGALVAVGKVATGDGDLVCRPEKVLS